MKDYPETKKQYPINEDHIKYYKYLEELRKSGVTNMYGASPFLESEFAELTEKDANDILVTWMTNYSELNKRFNWQ